MLIKSQQPPTDVHIFQCGDKKKNNNKKKIQSWIEPSDVFVAVYVDRIPRQSSKAELRKKVMPVCSPLPPEPNLSWEEEVSLVSPRCVSMGSVCEKMDFHVLREYLHQRKLLAPSGGEGSDVC